MKHVIAGLKIMAGGASGFAIGHFVPQPECFPLAFVAGIPFGVWASVGLRK